MDQLDTLDRNKKLFPQKMWDLIHDERYQFCLRWSGDGQLVYLNRDEFEESYLKKPCNQFNTQKSISFVRQMNMYGFRKVDDCYYENDNFKRNCYHLLKNMIRRHPNKAPFNEFFPTTPNNVNANSNSSTRSNNNGNSKINCNGNNNALITSQLNNTNIRCNTSSYDNHTTTLAASIVTSSNNNTPSANRTPSPAPPIVQNNRFIHNISNNGSLSSTSSPSPSPSPSIDNNIINNNSINMINGHNNFQQQLSNMVLNLSNQAAIQFGNINNSSNNNNNNTNHNNNHNHCPIKYENHYQLNDLIHMGQVPIPLDIQLELRHQYELQQKMASTNQLPPVSPLTKKLVTEICSKRNALLDQSALMDAARYTENFLNVLLDDASLIAQHSAGLDPADTSNQPACSSVDASSLSLALKLLPSKLLSSLQIYNKP